MKPVQIPSVVHIGITVTELHVFKKKKYIYRTWTNCENLVSINLDIHVHVIFGVHFMHCTVKSNSLEPESKSLHSIIHVCIVE